MMTLYTSTSLARDTIAILYYSIVLSAITVLFAMTVGIIQLLSIGANFESGPFWDGVNAVGDHYDILGGAICASFVVVGGVSVVCYKPWRRRVNRGRHAVLSVELQDIVDKNDDEKVVTTSMPREIGVF